VGQWGDALVRVPDRSVDALSQTFNEGLGNRIRRNEKKRRNRADDQRKKAPQPHNGAAGIQVLPTGADARVQQSSKSWVASHDAKREVVLRPHTVYQRIDDDRILSDGVAWCNRTLIGRRGRSRWHLAVGPITGPARSR